MLSDSIIAYLSGFFDAQGLLKIRRRKIKTQVFSFYASVTQDNPSTLLLFQRTWGGVIHTHDLEDRKNSYTWKVDTQEGEKMLRDMRPYLLVKLSEADVCLKFLNNDNKEKDYKDLERLKKGINHLIAYVD